MIRFYYNLAPNPMKVALCLEEMGLKYELAPVDTRKGEQHAPAYLAINPNAKVPAIIDDGATVFDSNAILLYLAEKTGQLLPTRPAARAKAYEWLGIVASDIAPAYSGQFVFNVIAPAKDPWAIGFYDKLCLRLLAPMESRLAASRHLAGDDYSIADVVAYPVAAVSMKRFPGDLSGHPNIARWAAEVGARPAVQRGMKVPR